MFRGISSVTGAINTTTSSFNTEFGKIGSTTASIHLTTASLNTYTGSNETWKTGVRGEVSALEAWTASLDNTYATDAQLYQLYQATASIHFTTSSLNTQTGSQDLVNRGISSVTGSINTTTSSFNTEFGKIGSTTSSIHFTTSSLNTQTGSQDLVNRGISSVTGSINITTSSFNTEFSKIGSTTSSIHFATQSLNTQTGSQESINTTISIVTGSMRAEIGGVEAYTASLKNAFILNGTNVRIVGELTASKIYTEFITSSISFTSGSTKIGDQSSDRHELTGSLNVSGSMTVSGSIQTFSEIGIAMESTTGVNKITARRSNSLADNATLDTGINQSGLLVVNTNSDRCALFLVNCIGGGSSTVTEISDPAAYYSVTKDNASTFNVYFDGGNGNVIAQNKTGAARSFSLTILGGS